MKRLLFFVLLMTLAAANFAQTEKLTSKEKKALRQKEAQLNLEKLKVSADQKSWVIETHTVYDRQGVGYPVNPSINFVALVEETLVVQLSFFDIPGWNGVGGITMEGKISKYEVKQKEGKPISIALRASGAVMGSVDLQVSVNSSGQGTCTIRAATTSTRITFAGQYVDAAESTVYQGATFK